MSEAPVVQAKAFAADLGFVEGPVVRGDNVVCTSIDRGCVYEVGRSGPRELAVTGGGPNGAAAGPDGSLFVAQNGGRNPARRWPDVCGGVQVVEPTGSVRWLTRDPVSPNDLCFGPDGYLYVTDPTRGPARNDGRLWRCDIETGEAELLVSVPWYPNGIAFGLQDDAVFVASTGERRIVRFELQGGWLGQGATFATLPRGLPDGLAFDALGNLIVAVVGEQDGEPGQIWTFDPGGSPIDVFCPGSSRKYTNVALDTRSQLFITDADEGVVLVAPGWPNPGLDLHPFRVPRGGA
jgi:gluconolactonase